MVIQNTLNNLKDRPKDERKVVAGGIAISIVVVLLAAWGIMFFRKIQSGVQQVNLNSGAQEQFNFTSVNDAQQQLQQNLNSAKDELQQLRTDAAQQPAVQQTVQPTTGTTNQFGSQTTTN